MVRAFTAVSRATLSWRIISTAPSAVFGVAVDWPANTDRAATSASTVSDFPPARRVRRSPRLMTSLAWSHRAPTPWIAAGVLIDLAYVVSIGGDFMSGRFLALPLVAAVLILSRAVPFEPAQALTAAGLLAVVGLTSAQVPLLSDSRVDRTNSEGDLHSTLGHRADHIHKFPR